MGVETQSSIGRELVKMTARKTGIHQHIHLCYPFFLHIYENNNWNDLLIAYYGPVILPRIPYVFLSYNAHEDAEGWENRLKDLPWLTQKTSGEAGFQFILPNFKTGTFWYLALEPIYCLLVIKMEACMAPGSPPPPWGDLHGKCSSESNESFTHLLQ